LCLLFSVLSLWLLFRNYSDRSVGSDGRASLKFSEILSVPNTKALVFGAFDIKEAANTANCFDRIFLN
jgi:hypothetical protein